MDSYSNAAINLLLLGRLFRFRGNPPYQRCLQFAPRRGLSLSDDKRPLRKKEVKKCSIREIYHSLQCQGLSWLVTELGLK